MNNEKLVLSMLNKALKSKKKKVLSCEICGEEKKSAVGFFTHKQVCGKTAEVSRYNDHVKVVLKTLHFIQILQFAFCFCFFFLLKEKEQMRITCEVCGKSVMPVSLRSHMLIHQRKTVLEEFQSAASPVVSCPTTPTTPGSSRSDHSGKKNRRAAATRYVSPIFFKLFFKYHYKCLCNSFSFTEQSRG